MRIGIYGISCSGKDTFIEQLLNTQFFATYIHPKGSKSLNEIANKKFSTSFENLSDKLKNQIRKEYALSLSKEKNILVDGHYCFYKNGDFKIVFTDEDLNLYDCFVYIRTNPNIIKKRIEKSDKNKKFWNLSEKEFADWQEKEIIELRDICFSAKKEFIVIDNDFESSMKFLSSFIKNYATKNSFKIASEIVLKIKSISENKKVALLDCDRTICEEDTGSKFFDENNYDKSVLKEIFDGDVYSRYQVWKFENIYKNFSVFPKYEDIKLNSIVIQKLKELKKNGYFICGLTAGSFEIWKGINSHFKLFDFLVANDFSKNSWSISDFVKGEISRKLSFENETFAVGDSLLDIFMLEYATNGFIYAPKKLRSSICKYFQTHKESKIKQFKENEFQYENVEAL